MGNAKLSDYGRFVLGLECPNVNHDIEAESLDSFRRKHALRGLISEVGELADALKKAINYDLAFNQANAVEELGDIMFYMMLYCDATSVHSYNLSFFQQNLLDLKTDRMTLIDREMFKLCAGIGRLATFPSYSTTRIELIEISRVISQLAILLDTTVEDVIDKNMEKLSKRYKNGFNKTDCVNRNLTEEAKTFSSEYDNGVLVDH